VEDVFRLDEELARARLSQDDFVLVFPIEPTLLYDTGMLVVEPGVDGVGVDIDVFIEELVASNIASGPVDITATQTAIAPSMTDAEAEAAATRLNELTEDGMLAAVGRNTARLAGTGIRRHLSSTVENGEMSISIDIDGLQADLERLFPGPQGDFRKPVLDVVDGVVRVVEEGVPPPVCCSTDSVVSAAEDFLAGGVPLYQLETRPDDDEDIVAWANGSHVREVVSEFTTSHPCCESRVTNIQNMADAVTGFYLVPGETLSFNEYIGPRTRDKGYVAAGAIRGGYMTDEVGGGVSQFVTTMFNAAFFGGLELDEYQSHSVYFSRYPFGREATLSIPGPDLVLTNTTDYPVLIWPTYDANSITVTLYSTRHIEVAELDQRVTRRGQCRHSEIDRQRTYPDGRVVVDTIVANYRPGDGIDCNGNDIPRRD
jgi:vancomycin resistance protein YoaR